MRLKFTYGDLFLYLLAVFAAVLLVESQVREVVLDGIRADWHALALGGSVVARSAAHVAIPALHTGIHLSRATGRNLLFQALVLPLGSLGFMFLAAIGLRLNWRRSKVVTAR
jgi:hypothetical protein